jgi:hypothetical protein
MTCRHKLTPASFALAVLLSLGAASPASAQKTPLRSTVELTAHGGVKFKTPRWVVAGPNRPEVAVLRNEKVKGPDAFLLMMLSVERAPSKAPDWDAVRQNIIKAARANKASLNLTLQDEFTELAGVQGKRMRGSLLDGEATLAVEIIALYKDGRMATVTLISVASSQGGQDVVSSVAATAVFKPSP